jgi:membrane-associated protease RseP (regulator of RpoE activity)
MSFVFYDLTFLAVLIGILTVVLIVNRKRWKREGIVILYRTKLGIKAINYIGTKFKRIISATGFLVTGVGYLLMIAMIGLLLQLVYLFYKFPSLIQVVKIPPIAPLIPYLPRIFKIDYLPPFYFTYWIVVLAIAAVSHEFFHGIYAKVKNIEVKSTGFAFIGPFIGAFVEPNEEKVKKLRVRDQLPFLCAGTFANILMTILFFFVLFLFFIIAFNPAGVIFNTYTYSLINSSQIDSFGNQVNIELNGGLNLTEIYSGGEKYYLRNDIVNSIEEYDLVPAYEDTPALNAGLAGVIIEIDGKKINEYKDLSEVLSSKNPGENINIKTLIDDKVNEYDIILSEKPGEAGQAYLGIALLKTSSASVLGKLRNKVLFFKDPNIFYKPVGAAELMIFLYNLIWWIVLVNLSVALVNMLPVGIFDGGRVFYLTVLGLTKSEKIAKRAYKFSTYLILFIFVLLTYLWFINYF